jgi:hypothetical protein
MLAAGAVFLSCCHYVRATGYCLARPSISEWVDIWRIEGLLTQKLYRNGCIDGSFICHLGFPWEEDATSLYKLTSPAHLRGGRESLYRLTEALVD